MDITILIKKLFVFLGTSAIRPACRTVTGVL